VDFHRASDEQLRYSADTGLDNGAVLADGPTGVVDVPLGMRASESGIKAAVDSLIQFFEATLQVLDDAMRSGGAVP
jgi:hypothetical protein